MRAERLRAELVERLDSPELEEEIGQRPIEDIVTEIRRDLGLEAMMGCNPWKRRAPAEIAALHARAAQPPGTEASPAPVPLPLPPGLGREAHQGRGEGL